MKTVIGAVRLSFQLTLSVAPLNFTAIEDLLNLIISSTPEKLSRWPPYYCQGHHAQKSQWPSQHWIAAHCTKFPCFCTFPCCFCDFIPCLQSAMLQLKNKFVNWVPSICHRDQPGKSPCTPLLMQGSSGLTNHSCLFPCHPISSFFSVAGCQLGNQLWRGNVTSSRSLSAPVKD